VTSTSHQRLAPAIPALVRIDPGDFTMGDAGRRPDERPAHRVYIPAFRAAVAPVTNAEYLVFVRATGAPAPPFAEDPRFNPPEQPVVGISWHDATAYCAWLTEMTGIRFLLPTEAQRERAARGGIAGNDWTWPGDAPGGHPRYAELAVLDRPHAPSKACANAYGLMCMAENVHEWCSDWYDAGYYAVAPRQSPRGPATGRRRASRGGSWRHQVKFTRVSARASLDPSFRYNDFGFRVYADP
jgi:formylglycine-generating enzyme required for sulfatase activity